MSAPFTYKLKVPVAATAGTPALAEVKVRAPIVRDLLVTDAHRGDVAKARALLARVADLDLKVVDQLDAKDFEALSNIIGDFSGAEKDGSE